MRDKVQPMWQPIDANTPILQDASADGPLVLGFPQSGRGLPRDLAARMTDDALALPDTCWHVDALWHCVGVAGAGWIMPAFSRLLIDLNRQPEPVAISIPNTTPIVATETFGRKEVYRPGHAPTSAEITERIVQYWRPFHARMSALLAAARAQTGHAVLLDAHSISPDETRFAGRTPPPVAIKTGGGACCTASGSRAIDGLVSRHRHLGIDRDRYAKGGFIIHRHSCVADGISAVQIEIRQDLYMNPSKPSDPIEPSLPLAGFIRDVIAALAGD